MYPSIAPTSFFHHRDDDHEILDNWDRYLKNDYEIGIITWREYLGNHNPNPVREDCNYYNFSHGDVDFFVLDVRAFREPEDQVLDLIAS